jgi:hypothetical protein
MAGFAGGENDAPHPVQAKKTDRKTKLIQKEIMPYLGRRFRSE